MRNARYKFSGLGGVKSCDEKLDFRLLRFGETIRYLTPEELQLFFDSIDNYRHKLMMQVVCKLGLGIAGLPRADGCAGRLPRSFDLDCEPFHRSRGRLPCRPVAMGIKHGFVDVAETVMAGKRPRHLLAPEEV